MSHVCIHAALGQTEAEAEQERHQTGWLAGWGLCGSHGPHTHAGACSPRLVKTSLDARSPQLLVMAMGYLQFANSAPVPVRSIYLLADADQANLSVECSFRALSRLKSLSFCLSHQVDGLQVVVVCMVGDSIALRPFGWRFCG
jgi:hypothetical protein